MKDDRNKTVTLSTRVTPKEYEKFNNVAKAEDKRTSELIRDFIRAKIKEFEVKK